MKDIRVIDDFLSEENYRPIYKYFMCNGSFSYGMPWYYSNGIVKEGDGIQFISPIYSDYKIDNDDAWEVIKPIIHKINSIAFYRIKANLTISGNIQSIDDKEILHIDNDYCKHRPGVMTTGIYYVNSNNGYTLFEDGTKVESLANRFVVFPCHIKHGGMPFTDDSKRRIVINFNWF